MNEKLSLAKKIGNFISNILLGDTKETIIRTDEKVKGIGDVIAEIKTDIKGLADTLAGHGESIVGLKVHTKYGVSNSPTVPSELGKKILEDSGFNKVYPELKPQIFALMDAKNLRTLYDYEKGAQKSLEELENSPLMDSMKNHSVNHPAEPLELIFRVASWVIRDDYEKEHPIKKVARYQVEK